MKVSVKRLWHNMASVRGYLVQEAIDRGEDLVISVAGETMTIPNTQIEKRKFKTNQGNFNSRYSKGKYDLIDFIWKPDTTTEPVATGPVQQALF